MFERIKGYWYRNGQKTLATVLGSFAVVDLSPYADDIHEVIPWPHWHAALRLTAAAGIYWRAVQANRLPP